MTKFDVALQYFEDKTERNGFLSESDMEQVCTKLGLSYGERIRIRNALDKRGIRLVQDLNTQPKSNINNSTHVNRSDSRAEYHLNKLKKQAAAKLHLPANDKNRNDNSGKTSPDNAQKTDDYYLENCPSSKDKEKSSSQASKHLMKDKQVPNPVSSNCKVTEKGPIKYQSNIDENPKASKRKNDMLHISNVIPGDDDQISNINARIRKSEEASILWDLELPIYQTKPDKMFIRMLDEYPAFRGLIADELCLLHNSESSKIYKCREIHFITDDEKIRIIELHLYDVFVSAYRRAKLSSLDFENLLSDFWLELCESIEKCRKKNIQGTTEDYVGFRLSRRIAKFKEELSLDSANNEYNVGTYEEICINNSLAGAFILREKSDLEYLFSDVETLFDRCSLSDREKRIIADYLGLFSHARTFDEISAEFNLSRSRIQQIYNKAMRKLSARIRFILEHGCLADEWPQYWDD